MNSNSGLAIVLLDWRCGPGVWEDFVSEIRDMDGPAAGVPVVLLGKDEPSRTAGLSGFLALPLDHAEVLAMIEHWCGPLEDHDFRCPSNPHYRLTRLSGAIVADELLGRFADQLGQALAYLDDPDPTSSVPHQIAGLAGMIGYEALGQDWRAIDGGEAVDHQDVRDRVIETIHQIKARISAR